MFKINAADRTNAFKSKFDPENNNNNKNERLVSNKMAI